MPCCSGTALPGPYLYTLVMQWLVTPASPHIWAAHGTVTLLWPRCHQTTETFHLHDILKELPCLCGWHCAAHDCRQMSHQRGVSAWWWSLARPVSRDMQMDTGADHSHTGSGAGRNPLLTGHGGDCVYPKVGRDGQKSLEGTG